ncbi:ion transporter [Methanocella sp. MCL-LM]|uniref:ion transporter n=1 Tax=Methanocella sp. MCL-LM TaxID=3412035 RepID=UPI003C77C20F
MYHKLKHRVYQILEGGDDSGLIGKCVNVFIIVLILTNVAAIILETEAGIYDVYAGYFQAFEVFSVAVFSIEYLLRVWVCTEYAEYSRPVLGRLRYMTSLMALIDLLAIIPFYLPMFIPVNLRVLRLLRIFRVFRLLKLARYTDAVDTIIRVINERKAELSITLFVGAILLIISSTLVYYAEFEAQPDKFSSIIATMWWSIITLLTVGYGDVYPITPVGRFFGALTAVFGIAMFALPAGLISSGFMEELNRQKAAKTVVICPHCGKNLTHPPEKAGAEAPVIIVKQADERSKR